MPGEGSRQGQPPGESPRRGRGASEGQLGARMAADSFPDNYLPHGCGGRGNRKRRQSALRMRSNRAHVPARIARSAAPVRAQASRRSATVCGRWGRHPAACTVTIAWEAAGSSVTGTWAEAVHWDRKRSPSSPNLVMSPGEPLGSCPPLARHG